MQSSDFKQLKLWFNSFVSGFKDMDSEGLKNILLKEDHTWRVVACMEAIAAGEGLSEEETLLALTVAMLHDVGRFTQYRRWRTFRDGDSDNHARLSVEAIRSQGVLDNFAAEERLMIEEAVRFHNMLALPEQFSSPTDLYIRLIRDADKLDIWRVFMEYYQMPEAERASAVGLGFPDLPEVTPACLEALANAKIVMLDQAKVLNDFKLLQISWVYDLNFVTTRRLLLERDYLKMLAATLPDDPMIGQAVGRAMEWLKR